MDNSDNDLLLADAKARLDEARADLEALERVQRMKNKIAASKNGHVTPPSISPPPVPIQSPENATPDESPEDDEDVVATNDPPAVTGNLPHAGRGALKESVRTFIANRIGTFTMLDVFAAVEASGRFIAKKQSIKAALGALEQKGEIATVTRGIGRKPSIYRRK